MLPLNNADRIDHLARVIVTANHSAVERIEIRQSCSRGVRKTAAQRNKNTATAPVHSQKPKCHNTECRSALRIGVSQEGSSRVRSNKDSLKKIPPSGNSVTNDQRITAGCERLPCFAYPIAFAIRIWAQPITADRR